MKCTFLLLLGIGISIVSCAFLLESPTNNEANNKANSPTATFGGEHAKYLRVASTGMMNKEADCRDSRRSTMLASRFPASRNLVEDTYPKKEGSVHFAANMQEQVPEITLETTGKKHNARKVGFALSHALVVAKGIDRKQVGNNCQVQQLHLRAQKDRKVSVVSKSF